MTLTNDATISNGVAKVTFNDDRGLAGGLIEIRVVDVQEAHSTAARVTLKSLENAIDTLKNNRSDAPAPKSRTPKFKPQSSFIDCSKDLRARAQEAEGRLFRANVQLRNYDEAAEFARETQRLIFNDKLESELRDQKEAQQSITREALREKEKVMNLWQATDRAHKEENKRLQENLAKAERRIEELQYIRDTERNLYNAQEEICRLRKPKSD